MRQKTKTGKARRRRPAAKDLAARKDRAGGGAARANGLILPYLEQDNVVGTRSGRIGSLAVDPNDPG